MLSILIGLALVVPVPSAPFQTGAPRPSGSGRTLADVDVPLEPLPDGASVGPAYGVAFLDYDGDGWIDLYVNFSGGLWRNQGGTGFTRVADLGDFMPPRFVRYGASCGDFDGDGLPDIACEPRADCFYLLRNLGAGNFLEVATDPEIVIDPPQCGMQAETFCWADVDEDGDLDLWLPAYRSSISPGNQFFENLGPTGPGGAHRLANRTLESGLGFLGRVNRPEGAQFVDADRDGDLDAFANGTLYQNVTGMAGPRFRQLVDLPTGIHLFALLDEGAMFLDYDLDGDQDLFTLFFGERNVIWENEGDGTFHEAVGVMPHTSLALGCSAEDWDLDGDIDLSADRYFLRNLLVESGQPLLRLASHSLGTFILSSPAWCDWDRDGDIDCVLGGASGTQSPILRNTTYGTTTGALQKLTLRVRPVRDSALVPRGLETEFGATVELRVHGDESGHVRRRFTASSHGYLQQSEYALTMALQPGPDPEAPARGVVFDLLVDFPSLPASGILRIDPSVNPALGRLELAALAEREITVFRSGLVHIDGVDVPPLAALSTRLASTGALVLPVPGEALPEPGPAPGAHWIVGMEVETLSARGPVRVQELVLDGQLAPAGLGPCAGNVLLYDVTHAGRARLLRQEVLRTSPRNDRSFLTLDWLLPPRHVYRVLCRVTELRASPRLAQAPAGTLANRGALSFAASDPCAPAVAGSAVPDDTTSYLELRYRITAMGEQR
ncbi:MAG TPA: VCBS repeat-containing protein [Planctomycetota bacterium]